jgi:uncharacterized protein (TIGR03435 family)
MTMAGLASRLTGRVSRIVQDRTGLRGVFDLDIEFSPDLLQQPGPPGANANPGATDSSVPSIFAALQEQLGLKLESTRGPVDVLIIDRVEHPTED